MNASTERFALVFDIGGSHISAAICSGPGNYRVGSVITAAHPAEETSEAFVNLLHSLGVEAGADNERVRGASLAIPGPFDYATGVSHMKHKLPYLFGVNLHAALAARFGWQAGQVCSLNDADAFLLGEIGAGAARGVARAVGLTLGTGIGSAFAVNGHVVTEGPGVPPDGEIWNLPYEGGIVEDSVSTRAIQRYYRNRAGASREVAELAADAVRDPAAVEAFNEFGRHLGLAIRSKLCPFAPNVVVLGGGISRSAPLFLPATLSVLQGLKVELRISTLLDHAALVGAGVRWFETRNGADGVLSQALAGDAFAGAV
ncbi:MAG: ROK family protein [Terracidiphilus sp.]